MSPDTLGRHKVFHLRAVCGAGVDETFGDDFVSQNLAIVVDVRQKAVQRFCTLFEACFEVLPVGGTYNTRDDVKGDDFVFTVLVAVNRKCNSVVIKRRFRNDLTELQFSFGKFVDFRKQRLCCRAGSPIREAKLIVKAFGVVVSKSHVLFPYAFRLNVPLLSSRPEPVLSAVEVCRGRFFFVVILEPRRGDRILFVLRVRLWLLVNSL